MGRIKDVRATGMTIMAKAIALTAALMLTTWLFIVFIMSSQQGFTPATCLATHCFCELPRWGTSILQPSNSLSSFGFVFVGCYLIFEAHSAERASVFSTGATIIYGIGAIIVGVGSALLHATLSLWGQFADVLGMYLVSGFSLVYALTSIFGLKRNKAAIYYVLLCTILAIILIMAPEVRRWLFLVILIIALVAEIAFARPMRMGVKLRYILLANLALIVAFGIWTLDQQQIICIPTSWLQGHAVWHFLGAASLFLTSRYYRSEQLAGSGPS